MNLKSVICTAAALLCTAGGAFAQNLITFETRAEAGSIAGVAADANISGGSLSRGAGVNLNAGGTYNSNNWQEGVDLATAITNNNYYSFTINVNSGFTATVAGIDVRYDRSGTGPNNLAILSSVTGFSAAATPVFTDTSVAEAGENQSITVSGHSGLSGTIEFRIYCWGATAAAGTFDIEVITTTPPGTGIVVRGSTTGGGGQTGACCAASGNCTTTTSAACTGTFLGNGTSCSPQPCPQPMGACCVNSFCVGDLSEANCLANGTGSVWGGTGTSCATFVCPEATGSCCTGATCTANVGQSQCSGVFTAAGTCTPNLCDDGACCSASLGACRVTFTEADCTTIGGTFTLGGTCSPNPCPQPSGACCLPNNTCVTNLDGLTCRGQSGVYLGVGTTCAPAICNRATGANLVAKYDFDVNVLGGGSRNLTFTTSVVPPFPTGDFFGVAQRYVDANLPFGLLDDSVFAFTGDAVGVIREDKVDSWFGSVDLFDIIVPTTGGTATATWTFDISNFNNLSLSMDVAAMGDFETAAGCSQPPCVDDRYEFAVSIDGGTPTPIFTAVADEAGSVNYTLASGAVISLNDPLVVNGTTTLTNVFQTLTASLAGTGSTLTLTLTASTDGADESFAIDNIMLTGDQQGGQTGACCAGTTCSPQTLAGCTGVFTRFAGVGTTCNAPGNNTTPCCKADYNASGTVTVQDIFDFLGGYFAGDAKADINAAGGVTVQDIFDYLAAYFAGCV